MNYYRCPNQMPMPIMPRERDCYGPDNRTTIVEPDVMKTLKSVKGKRMVVETVRGSVEGILEDVKVDHIVIKSVCSKSRFFIRIQEIVYVMPI